MNNWNNNIVADTFITKYKPKLLDDFHFETDLTHIIKTFIDLNMLNLLIVGGSNSGKTTLLFAIIREYYGIPPDQPINEHNILFINNLKEQGIQYYRTEMKTFCQLYSGISGKKRMIIVDDIDTINEQSQQVFRSYLDKYKNNICFISVCSNVQKVIESLQSRLHILRLPTPNRNHCTRILETIVSNENITITNDAKEYLLNISQDSIRNIINHLEKMWILSIHIDLTICKQLCFNIPFVVFEEYIKFLLQKNLKDAVMTLYDINNVMGYSVIDILDEFFTFIKLTDLFNEEQKYKCIPIICEFIKHFHLIHEDPIELVLFTNKLFNEMHSIYTI